MLYHYLETPVPVSFRVWCLIPWGVWPCLPRERNNPQDHGRPPCCSLGRVFYLSMVVPITVVAVAAFAFAFAATPAVVAATLGECRNEFCILCHDFRYLLALFHKFGLEKREGIKSR